MMDIFNAWRYGQTAAALEELEEYGMKERNEIAAEIQRFADWLATENSKTISASCK